MAAGRSAAACVAGSRDKLVGGIGTPRTQNTVEESFIILEDAGTGADTASHPGSSLTVSHAVGP